MLDTDELNNLRTEVDFRGFLHVDFSKRRSRNPKFSMRSYAKILGVDQSLLSKVFRGERTPSENFIFKIGLQLGLSEKEIRNFLGEGGVRLREVPYSNITDDSLGFISDWYPLALVELMQTKDFDMNEAWIASRLGISEDEARFAVAKLIAMRMIEKDSEGNWRILKPANNWLNPKLSSVGRRKLQKQYLNKAMDAIDNIPLEKRENLSMTIAVHPDALGEVKRRLKEFNESLRSFLNNFPEPSEVYQAAYSFFPLSREEEALPCQTEN